MEMLATHSSGRLDEGEHKRVGQMMWRPERGQGHQAENQGSGDGLTEGAAFCVKGSRCGQSGPGPTAGGPIGEQTPRRGVPSLCMVGRSRRGMASRAGCGLAGLVVIAVGGLVVVSAFLKKQKGHEQDYRLRENLAAIKQEDRRIAQRAAEALGRSADKRAVQPLIAALDHGKKLVREAACKALGGLGDKRAVEPLIAKLTDEECVAAAACTALANLGDLRAVEPLIHALTPKHRGIRLRVTHADGTTFTGPGEGGCSDNWAAAEALGKLGDKRAIVPLFEALTHPWSKNDIVYAIKMNDKRDRYETARTQAASSIEQFGVAAVGPLAGVIESPDVSVRYAAAHLLRDLGWEPDSTRQRVHYLIGLEDWDRLLGVGSPAVDPLTRMARQPQVESRLLLSAGKWTWVLGDGGLRDAVARTLRKLKSRTSSRE